MNTTSYSAAQTDYVTSTCFPIPQRHLDDKDGMRRVLLPCVSHLVLEFLLLVSSYLTLENLGYPTTIRHTCSKKVFIAPSNEKGFLSSLKQKIATSHCL